MQYQNTYLQVDSVGSPIVIVQGEEAELLEGMKHSSDPGGIFARPSPQSQIMTTSNNQMEGALGRFGREKSLPKKFTTYYIAFLESGLAFILG